MAKSQRPKGASAQNSKDFVVWSTLLFVLLAASALVFFKIRKDEGSIHIPDNAFEDVAKTDERRASSSDPNAVLLPRDSHNSGLSTRENQDTNADQRRSPAVEEAMALVDRGQWNEAEPLLLAELQKNPKDLDVLMELAMIQLIDKNTPASATPYLEEMMRIDPNNQSAMAELVNVYNEAQNFAGGVQFLKSLPQTDENRGMILAGLGSMNAGAGNNQEAISLLKSAIYESQNTSFEARKDLAEAYEAMGKPEEANQEYMQIINNSTYKPQQQRRAKIDLAKNYAAQRRYSEAQAILEGIVAANPKDKSAARTLSEIQAQAAR